MKKLLLLFCLMLGASQARSQTDAPAQPPVEQPAPQPDKKGPDGEKLGTLAKMIESYDKVSASMASIFGGATGGKSRSEETRLGAFNFPNWVEVDYSGETRKVSKKRRGAIGRWLKEFEEKPDDAKFYGNEVLVSEAGKDYWIIVHDDVLKKLAGAKKGDFVTLHARIPGVIRKNDVTDYLLLADEIA